MNIKLQTTTVSPILPPTLTPLSPNGFNLSIAKLPGLTYFSQQCSIPQLSLGQPDMYTPFSVQPIPGEMITYDQLTVQFLIDADMSNYIAIHKWLIGLGFPESYSQYNEMQSENAIMQTDLSKNYSDATLQILTGTNNVSKQIKFIDMFPVSLGAITFLSTAVDVNYVVGDVTFRYARYEFV